MTRKGRQTKPIAVQDSLVSALAFCMLVQKSSGSMMETHCIIEDNHITAFNGIVALSTPIVDELRCCPHTELLYKAVKMGGGKAAFQLLETGHLRVKVNTAQITIPCIERRLLNPVQPDPPTVLVGNGFLTALEIVAVLAKDTDEKVVNASVLLQNGSVIGSAGFLMLEAWHGFAMPTLEGVAIPKMFITALSKAGKAVDKLGHSPNSITVWFEDGTWMRTQIYADAWPKLPPLFSREYNYAPVLEGLMDAIANTMSFGSSTVVYLGRDEIRADRKNSDLAIVQMPGLPPYGNYDGELLMRVREYMKMIHWNFEKGKTAFCHPEMKVRGWVAGMGE